MYNRLLEQQLIKQFGSLAGIPAGLTGLLKEVSDTYDSMPGKDLPDPVTSGFDVLFENIDDVVFSVDMQKFTLTKISPACEKIYGYTPLEFYNNDNLWEEIIHPDDKGIARAQVDALAKGEVVFNLYRIIHKNKSIRWIENKVIPSLDPAGQLIRISGISTDRTESILREKKLYENEARLAQSEKKYRSIFESNPMPMWVLDLDTLKFLDVNHSAIRHYGYSKEEFLKMSATEIRPGYEKDRFLSLSRAWSWGLSNSGQWTHIKKDNSVIKVEVYVDTVEFEGRPARLVLAQDITERIKADEKLKESNERYELATKATNDAIWDWNLSNNELYWSEGYKKLSGYENSQQNANVHHWMARIHPEDVKRVSASIMQKINDREAGFWESEYRYIKADGTIVFIYDRGFIVYQDGIPVRMVGAMQDITKRKRAEDYLNKSEANLRNILENTDTAYLLLDENTRILSSNGPAKALAIEGVISGINEGKLYIDVIPFSRKSRVNEIIQKVLNSGKPESYEVRYDQEGRIICLHVSIHPIFNSDKAITGLSVAINNITARKMSEQLLHESEANLRTIFDNTDVSYIFLDKNLRVVSFNQRALMGYRKELGAELEKGADLLEYLPAARKEILETKCKTVLEGRKIDYDASFLKKDGTMAWFNINIFPVYDNSKNVRGIVIATENITDRKNAELEKEKITSELLQRNKTLEQFAYIISHNLRSPVANITGLSNIILNSQLEQGDFKRCMEGLALSVKKLDEVIIDLNHILQVRREITEKKENVKFSGLIRDIKTSINSIIEKEDITIKTNFINANELFAIKSYLNSIFYNLISNSIKYRNPRQRPVIEISSQKERDKVVLSFKDNGLGIDLKANGAKIFGLYKKFHNHIDGKGMGLFMVKTQVEILGGKIEVKSEVNKGTEFLIEFTV